MKTLVALIAFAALARAAPVQAQTLIRGTLLSHGAGPVADEVGHSYTRFRIIDMNGNSVGYYFREYESFLGWVEANYQPGDILAITGNVMQEIGGSSYFMIPININLRRNNAIVATVSSTSAFALFYSQARHYVSSSVGTGASNPLYIGVYCQYGIGQVPNCPDYPGVQSITFGSWCSILEASPVPSPYAAAHGRLLDVSIGCP